MLKILPVKDSIKYKLAHSITAKGRKFKKGKILSKDDVDILYTSGIKKIYVFQESINDVEENIAANTLAKYLSGKNIICKSAINGRADFYSKINGMVRFSVKNLTSLNFKNNDIALSMLRNESIVRKNQLIGNIKVLPYALNSKKLNKVLQDDNSAKLLNIKEKQLKKIILIISANELNNKINKKIIESIDFRLGAFNLKLFKVLNNTHSVESLTKNLNIIKEENIDLALIYGSTSIVDINDIIPASIKKLDGEIISFGAPTDPGNLLLLGTLNNIKIIGVPGCAKSLVRNGFDLVLEKICFGLKVNKKVIAEMSNGGLFKNQFRRKI